MDDGAKKRVISQAADGQGEGSDYGQSQKQEYDFFVNDEDGGRVEETARLRGPRRKKGRGRSKSRTFFLSD
jgi:hypothetical protein